MGPSRDDREPWLMLFDIRHRFRDAASPHFPCNLVGMTVDLSAILPHGMLIEPRRVRWPDVTNGDMVVCGNCAKYLGECLNVDCIEPHTCVPVQRPDGAYICRAGCDGGK